MRFYCAVEAEICTYKLPCNKILKIYRAIFQSILTVGETTNIFVKQTTGDVSNYTLWQTAAIAVCYGHRCTTAIYTTGFRVCTCVCDVQLKSGKLHTPEWLFVPAVSRIIKTALSKDWRNAEQSSLLR